MEHQRARDLTDHFALCATATALTEGMCGLPAVATLDWCDQAAQCLLTIGRSVMTSVSIATISEDGRILNHEATGVATNVEREQPRLTALRVKIERLTTLGQGALGTREPFASPESPLARLWQEFGASDLIISSESLGRSEQGRRLFVQVAMLDGHRVTDMHRALMGAAMPRLVDRALMAIGPTRTTAGRWLTERERQILERLTLGMSVREIAEELGRSPHTVHDHVKSLHRKLDASSRGELIARALGHLRLYEKNDRIVDPKPLRTMETADR
ncbi:MAG: helix-turn-helix transcriptional regulator [Phycisphaerales bacterium]|nr:helix-turn-helix transcriptional regulator [Phycisphaerales bacterium]